MARGVLGRSLLTLGLCGAGCVDEVAVPAPTRTVELPGLRLVVPASASVLPSPPGQPARAKVELHPGARGPRSLTIAAAGRVEGDLPLRLDLPAALLRARVEAAEGGSGGPELTLIGRLELAGDAWAVRCRDQDEDRPSLRWCLELLRALHRP